MKHFKKRIPLILGSTLVYGTFWKDMSELFIRAKFMNKEALKLLEDLENRLHYLFTPY